MESKLANDRERNSAVRALPQELILIVLGAAACLGMTGCGPCLSGGPLFDAAPDPCDGWSVEADDEESPTVLTLTTFYRGEEVTVIARANEDETEDVDRCAACQRANQLLGAGRATASRGSRIIRINQRAADIVSADFNEDDQTDVALIFEASNVIAIVLTDGPNLLEPVEYAIGAAPVAIEAADVNRDGFLDLLTANAGTLTAGEFTGGDVSLLLGNRNGAFQPASSIAAGQAPRDLGIGDFNGDGNLDLAIANAPNRSVHALIVRLGNGDGTFQGADVLDFPGVQSLVVADFNVDVDNHDDLATNSGILLGRGDGTFAPVARFPLGFDVSVNVVELSDLNADRKPDVLAGSFTSGIVSVLAGNGDGTLRTPRHYLVDGQPRKMQIRDLDKNGYADILVAGPDGIGATLLGKGDGSFYGVEAHAVVPDPVNRLGGHDAAVDDFTGDGVPDVVVANQYHPSILLPGLGGGALGAMRGIANAPQAGAVVAGDWNRDGKPDLAFTGKSGDSSRLFVMLGNGNGTFAAPSMISLPDQDDEPDFLAQAFVDAGNSLDLLVANTGTGGISVFLGDGNGGFAPQPVTPIGLSPIHLVTGDLNGDGKLDLAVAYAGQVSQLNGGVKIALGNGDGTFQSAQTIRDNAAPDTIAIADFNGDGTLDLAGSLESRQFSWDVEVFLGNGNGTFSMPRALGLRALGLTANFASRVFAADMDGDGKTDLGFGSGSLGVGLRGKGDGTFDPAVRGPLRGGRILVADLDLDGWPDLIAPSHDGFVGVVRNTLFETGLARPALSIVRSMGMLELSWPPVFRNFGLFQTDSLSPPVQWKPITSGMPGDGLLRVLLESVTGTRFFRLENPE